MEISSSTSALAVYQGKLNPQAQAANLPQAAQQTGAEGRDREPDRDGDDGSVTATRGQNLNITA